MPDIFTRISAIITGYPKRALGVLAALTLLLAAGNLLLAEQADQSVFLPPDSEVAIANDTLGSVFPDSAGLVNATLLHRGDVFTVEGLSHMSDAIDRVVGEPSVRERLALTDPVISIPGLVATVAGVENVGDLSQAQLDQVLNGMRADPELAALLENLSGTADGEGLAISSIRLRELGDADGLEATELLIADLAEATPGPLDISVLSTATVNEESSDSSQSSMMILMVIALVVIAVLLFVFFRTGSDVLLGMAGALPSPLSAPSAPRGSWDPTGLV